MELIASASPLQLVDWPSLGWVALIGSLTFACLTVKSRFEHVSRMGRFPELLAHVVIGYFGLGMTAFGGWAAATATFPVPGGHAWEGPVAVAGGLAALTIGSCTLAEHLMQVRAMRREPAQANVAS